MSDRQPDRTAPGPRPASARRGVSGIVWLRVVVLVVGFAQLAYVSCASQADRAPTINVEQRMSDYGYKPAPGGENEYPHVVLGADRYAYCPTPEQCNTPAVNADHPPVDVFGTTVSQVHVWWPAEPSYGVRFAGQRFTVCTTGPSAVASVTISNDRWAANVATLADHARGQVLRAMVDSPQRLPGETQSITVDGWLCPVPTGPSPFRS